jgi:hypothetical protein
MSYDGALGVLTNARNREKTASARAGLENCLQPAVTTLLKGDLILQAVKRALTSLHLSAPTVVGRHTRF